MTPPPSEITFCAKLRSLRDGVSVEELAKRSGVAASSIYKMEQTPRVKWATVEKTYRSLFTSPQEHCETLMLWALEQTEQKTALIETAAITRRLLTQEVNHIAATANQLNKLLQALTPQDQVLLLSYAEKYRNHEPTRLLTKAWLNVVG